MPDAAFYRLVDVRTGIDVASSEEASSVDARTVQLLAVLMSVAHGVAWGLWSRWERPGLSAELRVEISPPPLLSLGSDLVMVAPLVYPVFVVVAPGWGYDGSLNWSSRSDLALQGFGLAAWAGGVALGIWAGWVLGRHMGVNGVASDHELVVRGPYGYVRHPLYASFIAIAVGTALLFRSFLMVAVAFTLLVAVVWWSAAEEEVLASSEGFGDGYRSYAERTGRFLPRLRRLHREPRS